MPPALCHTHLSWRIPYSLSCNRLLPLSWQQHVELNTSNVTARAVQVSRQVSDTTLDGACNRRQLAIFSSCLLLPLTVGSKSEAEAANLPGALKKYIKRKKLDPLDTYVAPLLLSQLQLQDIEMILLSDKPSYADARSLLRSGPVASLRIDIRAVAQYASEAGNGQGVFEAVDQCIRTLEEMDSVLLRAERNESPASVKIVKDKIDTAVLSLDRLLETVPAAVLEKCRAIVAAYKDVPVIEQSDSDIKAPENHF